MNSSRTFDFYLLRSPSFPTQVLEQINNNRSFIELADFIIEFFNNPIALNALFFSSIEVYEQFVNLKNDISFQNEKLLLTLYKYICRMSSRPTPFGLFSGISYGQITVEKTSLVLSSEIRPSIRYDEEFILKLSEQLSLLPDIRSNIKFVINNTIAIKNNTITYIEFIDEEYNRHFQWRRIQLNPLLENILAYCKSGIEYKNIIAHLENFGINTEKAKIFVDELIAIKLLISELEPVVTKEDTSQILFKLNEISVDTKYFPFLNSISKTLDLEFNIQTTEYLSKSRNKIERYVHSSMKNIYQVDSKLSTLTNQIEESLINEIAKEIDEISLLNKTKLPDDLKSFISSFKSRYEDREIRLIDALDPEIGIGYGIPNNEIEQSCPLLEGIVNQKPNPKVENFDTYIHDILENKFNYHCASIPSIEITSNDLKMLTKDSEKNEKKYPIGFSVIGNLLSEKNTTIDKNNFRFNLIKVGGVSGLPLLTRFSHLDKRLKSKQYEIASHEEELASNRILAEIVFLPNRRAGNILTRPSFYQYEIPIITHGTVEEDHVIKLEDLFVKIRNGQVILTSHKLKKEIIPRLSSAHNFAYGMVIYRFLCDLQLQSNNLNVYWDWGNQSNKKLLPRVTYKHLILARATWNIKQQKFPGKDEIDIEDAINTLKKNYNLPDRVLLIEGDNELFIDLTNSFGRAIFLKEISKKDISVCEYIYDNFQSALKNKNGDYFNNEIVIPFKGNINSEQLPLLLPQNSITQRQFPLGSEWVYIKIYLSERIADHILEYSIQNLVMELKKKNLISKWFFIRYNDPNPHLRIRFHLYTGDNLALADTLLLINTHVGPLLTQDKVSKIQYDTYERELERYGASNIENCENIFYLHSELILHLLPVIKSDLGNEMRWLIAMKVVNEILSVFDFDLSEKINFVERERDRFIEEFKKYKNLKISMDKNYREKQRIIQDFFYPNKDSATEIHALLLDHQNLINKFYLQCKYRIGSKRQQSAMIASIIHMFLNRIFSFRQREQEMVVYHFLLKFLITESKKNL
ncbi:lantibiotic dehydratase [Sphingobacterium athyrii]|uniref:Lantibiotic dehydratase n=1 Tax=Sphingobacterium athyrii TaxID=2152717 RepID=A0A363NLN5_9SPHI|nr:lantibiotic dehydratase [Sphingobacterium athyrii]PUV21551.1 hypothetical protein DCO56_27525 [Sphingobacterium athyrii]